MTGFSTDTSQATGNRSLPLDSQSPKEMELTRLGRYQLCYELASGGMATVYLARMDGIHGFEKIVALKRIHPHLVSDRSYLNMFLDEARIASGITHPNVCSVFDFGEFNGEYYLAMEYLVGEPLARLWRRAGVSPEQRKSLLFPLKVAKVIEEACEGLHAAHESKDTKGQPLNVVHRDVTPRNLFITYSGAVQVVDFGIASAKQRVHQTSTGQLKGTVPYMAPEQVRGGQVDRRVDIWGLGVVLWELLTLERLFRRETEVESMYAVLMDDIPTPSARRPGIPPELDAIVMKALQREPKKRWRTAREMGQALREFATDRSADVGAADLSEWMEKIFPEGETRQREIMELAMTQTLRARPDLTERGLDATEARTVAGDIESAIAARGASTEPPATRGTAGEATISDANAKRKSKPVGPMIALGVLLAAITAVWGLQASAPEPPPSSAVRSVVEPVVAPVEPTLVKPIPSNAQELRGNSAEAAAPKAEMAASEKIQTDQPEAATPRGAEAAAAAAKPSKLSIIPRKPRSRKKPSQAIQAEPAASGLPGHVKIVTKGHSVEIYEGSRLLGRAPALLTLPAGRHKLRLKSMESGESMTLPVEVVANATKTISLDVD